MQKWHFGDYALKLDVRCHNHSLPMNEAIGSSAARRLRLYDSNSSSLTPDFISIIVLFLVFVSVSAFRWLRSDKSSASWMSLVSPLAGGGGLITRLWPRQQTHRPHFCFLECFLTVFTGTIAIFHC